MTSNNLELLVTIPPENRRAIDKCAGTKMPGAGPCFNSAGTNRTLADDVRDDAPHTVISAAWQEASNAFRDFVDEFTHGTGNAA